MSVKTINPTLNSTQEKEQEEENRILRRPDYDYNELQNLYNNLFLHVT